MRSNGHWRSHPLSAHPEPEDELSHRCSDDLSAWEKLGSVLGGAFVLALALAFVWLLLVYGGLR